MTIVDEEKSLMSLFGRKCRDIGYKGCYDLDQKLWRFKRDAFYYINALCWDIFEDGLTEAELYPATMKPVHIPPCLMDTGTQTGEPDDSFMRGKRRRTLRQR